MASNNPDVPKTAKAFVPLENNPEVMSSLVHKLGLSPALSFHDVFSIDDPDLLSFVPRPASALLLVFPVSETYEKHRTQEDDGKSLYDGKGAEESVIWYRQTIRNSCGLMGLLHAVSNGGAKAFIGISLISETFMCFLLMCFTEPDSDLAKLVSDVTPLAPTDRAAYLYDSRMLESAHGEAAQQGQSSAPGAADDIDLHYVCFVKDEKTDHLWELDGRRKGPLDRGVLDEGDDVLSEKALELGPRQFMKREEEIGGGEMRFSLVTLAPSLD